ncbi:uncharacterized protein LOC106536312 [Austrofundulus limnaeus]|uniref:Uncharacterized protein LOC106536312 n=1 Tax=Austrofundulus limnaeus TaxID=52670 RepID=A0A2I4D9R2_AUSLI|nr:PREDICTED: uncharacterized protein LOC106536312 [Austrofundulus limnaeus]
MFNRQEDDEVVVHSPYRVLINQIHNPPCPDNEEQEAAEPSAPPPYKDTPRTTRSQGEMPKWSKKMGGLFSPTPPQLLTTSGPEVEICPLIALPHPMMGQDNGAGGVHPDQVLVYRTWTQEDVKKACEGIPPPKEDVEQCIQGVNNLRASYHLNGVELQQVWMCIMGATWHLVRGDYDPNNNNQNPPAPLAPGSAELDQRARALNDRVRQRYRQRADYTEIGRCRQKDDEPFDDYRVRMTKVFRAHSGLVDNGDENGPYQQQLKNALHAGSTSQKHHWVSKHYIGLPNGTLSDYLTHAVHAERVTKIKKNTKATEKATFWVEEDENAVYWQNPQARGRGRGRSRGRGRGGLSRSMGNPRACWSCGKEGHMARDCRSSPQNNPSSSA